MNENTELAPISFAEMTQIIEQEFAIREQRQPQTLPDWYLAKLADIQAKRELVKAQADRILHLLEMEEAATVYKFGELFRQQFEVDLAARKSKGKFIDYMFGRAKKISQGDKIEVLDDELALTWAEVNLPAAIKIERSILKMPLGKHFFETGELPGGCVLVPGREKTYPVCNLEDLGPKAKRLVEALLAAPSLPQAEPKALEDTDMPLDEDN